LVGISFGKLLTMEDYQQQAAAKRIGRAAQAGRHRHFENFQDKWEKSVEFQCMYVFCCVRRAAPFLAFLKLMRDDDDCRLECGDFSSIRLVWNFHNQ
jgi:hypothetical protein